MIAVAGQTGELVPLYCTAHGKALIADADEHELRSQFGAGPLQMYTKNTITTIKALAKECAAIRERGYATDESEYATDMRCIAAPIRLGNDIVGSIGISAPSLPLCQEPLCRLWRKGLHCRRDGSARRSARRTQRTNPR